MNNNSMNQKGFSLIQGLVAVGIMSLVAMSVAGLFTQMAANQKRNNIIFMLQNKKLNLEQSLRDDRTWQKILAHDNNQGQLQCLRKMQDCMETAKELPDPPGELIPIIVDGSNRVLVDSTITGNNIGGMTYQGTLCQEFVDRDVYFSENGNDQCPLRLEVRWRPICDKETDTSCLNPQIQITGSYKHSPYQMGKLNLNFAQYQIEVVRPGVTAEMIQQAMQKYVEEKSSVQQASPGLSSSPRLPSETASNQTPSMTVDDAKKMLESDALKKQDLPKEFTEGMNRLLEAQKQLEQLQKELKSQQEAN